MKTKSILTVIVTLGLCAGAATAKGGGKNSRGKPDTNNDGLISLAEFTAKSKNSAKATKRFEKGDANHDGQLDRTELATLKKKGHHKGGGKRRKANQ